MRRASLSAVVWCAGASSLVSVGCCPHKINSFSVTPDLVCPGELVNVTWNVRGRAVLREQRDTDDWDQGEVPSIGSRRVSPVKTTSFQLTDLDANPALGEANKSQSVQVPTLSMPPRGDTSKCDESTRICTTTFTLSPGSSRLHVTSVDSPIFNRLGRDTPQPLTLTHDTWSQVIPASGNVTVDLPASGAWMISTTLPADAPLAPPPRLTVHLVFSCR